MKTKNTLKTFALAILMAAGGKTASAQNGMYNMLTNKNKDRFGAKKEYVLDVSVLNSTQKAPSRRAPHVGLAVNTGIRFTPADYDGSQYPATFGCGIEYQMINESGLTFDKYYATYRRHSFYLTGTINFFITNDFYLGVQIKGGVGIGNGSDRAQETNFVYGERIEMGHKIGKGCEVFAAWGLSDFSNWRYGPCWTNTDTMGEYELGIRATIDTRKIKAMINKKRAMRNGR